MTNVSYKILTLVFFTMTFAASGVDAPARKTGLFHEKRSIVTEGPGSWPFFQEETRERLRKIFRKRGTEPGSADNSPVRLSTSYPESSGLFAAAKDKIVLIIADTKAGTGFLLRDGVRTWLYTNEHIVHGCSAVQAVLLDGRQLRLGQFELAENRDLVRFEIEESLAAFENERRLPDIGSPITVFGNSDGLGVSTELRGKVVGVGPGEIEVDAPFVHGNSGSPVLNRAGRVLGVATYLKDCRSETDWTKSRTRFNGIRRFAVRTVNVLWTKMTWDAYVSRTSASGITE